MILLLLKLPVFGRMNVAKRWPGGGVSAMSGCAIGEAICITIL
jgi:hypothetical protein